jgi:hypothetical protein
VGRGGTGVAVGGSGVAVGSGVGVSVGGGGVNVGSGVEVGVLVVSTIARGGAGSLSDPAAVVVRKPPSTRKSPPAATMEAATRFSSQALRSERGSMIGVRSIAS